MVISSRRFFCCVFWGFVFIAASYIARLEANKTSYLEMSMDTDQKIKKSPTKAYSLRQKVRDILERPEMVRPEPLNFRQTQQKKLWLHHHTCWQRPRGEPRLAPLGHISPGMSCCLCSHTGLALKRAPHLA